MGARAVDLLAMGALLMVGPPYESTNQERLALFSCPQDKQDVRGLGTRQVQQLLCRSQVATVFGFPCPQSQLSTSPTV